MRRLAVLLSLLAACRSPVVADLPIGAKPFAALAVYRQWWRLTQACSGIAGNLDAIAWYVMPGTTELPGSDGHSLQGQWYPTGNRILLSGSSQEHGGMVRHEMLHALLGSEAVAHPRSQFIDRCGGTVECDEQCTADGGGPPPADPDAVVVIPAVLDMSLEITPVAPSSTEWEGHFQMVLSARNATARALSVQLPPSRDAGPSLAYQYRLDGNGGFRSYNVRVSYPEITRFAAGEVKRFVFDFRTGAPGSRYDVSPGTYRFRGAYGETWAPQAPMITVSP